MASIDPEKSSQEPTDVVNNSSGDITAATSKHLDDNYELYKTARDIEVSPEELKRVLRKIDLRIVTVLFVTYLLQYLDKNSLNFSSVYGLQAGTHLNTKSQQYSWLGKHNSKAKEREGRE